MYGEIKETFAELTFPKVSPEKVIGDFLESKLNEKILKKYPEWDRARTDPRLCLVWAQRDFENTESRLTEKREYALKRRKQLDDEWKKLEEEQKNFKRDFLDFDKLIEENATKTTRAINKKKEWVLAKIETDSAIKKLEAEFGGLAKIQEEMESQVKKHSIYENYLQGVADHQPDEFANAQNVFDKFTSLAEARTIFSQQLDENILVIENTKDKLEQLLLQQSTTLIGLNNKITALHTRYTDAKKRGAKWEEVIANIQSELQKNLVEVLSVKESCWNLYREMCKHGHLPPTLHRDSFESQLAYINKFLVTLQKAVDTAQKAHQSNANSLLVEKPRSPKLRLMVKKGR